MRRGCGLHVKGCGLSEKGCDLVFHSCFSSKSSTFQVETVEEISGYRGHTLYKRLLVLGRRALLAFPTPHPTPPPPLSSQLSAAGGFHMSVSYKIM